MQIKALIRILFLIHGSFVISLLLFGGFVYLKSPSFEASADSSDIFIYLVPLVAAIGYFASKYLFQNLIQNIERKDGLKNKLSRYQLACIIKYAMIQGPAIFALVAYYYSGNALYLVVAFCLVAYLISQRPTVNRFQSDIQLTHEEELQLE